jgi:transposase InsO family protein
LPQCWPFAWWVAAIVDHFSRRVIAVRLFPKQPTSGDLQRLFADATAKTSARPRYLISDLCMQFVAADFKAWCRRCGIHQRYAAKRSLRATAVIERWFRSLKTEMLGPIPLTRAALARKLQTYVQWFNGDRPHQGLQGRTPDEAFRGLHPANRAPRLEPRVRWPATSGCARPFAPLRDDAASPVALVVEFGDRECALPIVTLDRAA